ncbi:MAG: hypothetical protein HYX32_15380 [Actinobacteria bacterium]|nr:hypothetical protein [Actinomycetota bacterium]
MALEHAVKDQPRTEPRTKPAPAGSRPGLTFGQQLAGVLFGLWMIVGLFLDGWAHTSNAVESFFTPWHGVLYSGFVAAAAAATAVAWSSRQPGRPWTETLPRGHGLTLLALGMFAAGGMGDLIWHQLLGVEVGVEALLSPTHLLLLTGGLIALSAPIRSAWGDPDHEPTTLGRAVPIVLDFALLTALVGFFLLYLSPFLNKAASTAFTRTADVPEVHPSTITPELQQLLGIASILMTTVLFSVPSYLLLRRWIPPRGAFTLFFGTVTVLFVGLDEFRTPWLVLAGVVAGAAGDVMVARRWPALIVVPTAIAVLWAGYFFLFQLTAGGVGWTVELWAGVIVLSALIAALLGLLTAPIVPNDPRPPAEVTPAPR